MRELIIKWLYEAMELETGEELYIPADNEANQKDLYSMLRKELGILRQLQAENAAKLRIYPQFKDMNHWVVIKKISVTPLVAFKKSTDGKVSRVHITNDKEQARINKFKEAANV